ncbi:MAG: glycosyltransferase [Chitinophagaceae bacterium]|nr:glycosyltransferase [Chitinophagaceae bacterium]MCW5928530.1 glycosyltransferase [Chitinophagaceae bacterium]
MIRNRDILIVGLQPWDIEIGSNCKNIAIELSRHNRVLYVNAPVDSNTLVKEKTNPWLGKRLEIMKGDTQLFSVANNLWNYYPKNTIYSINWIPNTSLFKRINRLNNKKFAANIKEALKILNFKDFILFNDSDMFRSYYLKELLNPTLSVYYSRDNLMSVSYWRRHGTVLEPELMNKSDLVTANSPYLARVAKQYNANSFYVGQGCDLSIFDPGKTHVLPDDLRKIKGPIIGYIGTIISSRLDINLLMELCRKKEEWNFVFVGNADEQFKLSGLFDLKNVYYLGLRKESELPSYLAGFNIAMNPQLISELTIGNYPRKIDEYLAMGKPVVATQTETMEFFREVVYLGKTAEDYIKLITKALDENSRELIRRRIEFAGSHTWENSVMQISNAIRQVRPELFRNET